MKKSHHIIFAVLLLLGVVARLFGAWAYRDCLNPDAGIVALMAKHMAEGAGFPVFFYGQAYMGSLEPFVCSLFCRLFGPTGFAVGLGPAFFGVLLLPILYGWGKEIGGPKAGLAAMAFLVVGPGGFFHYMGSSRGGYAATFFFGAVLLWLGGHILARELKKEPVSWGLYFLLGVVAGLAWWTHQLIMATLLSLSLLYLVLLHVRLFSWRVLAGAGGFFVGSAPFWIWNILNDWGTFSFLKSFHRPVMSEGLRLFFTNRAVRVLDAHLLPVWLRILVFAFYAGLFLWAMAVVVTSLRKRDALIEHIHLVIMVVFSVIFMLLFSVSHFAHFDTPRYLLPLIPPLAVLLGVATALADKRVPFHLAWVPIVLLIVFQCVVIIPGDIAVGMEVTPHLRDAHELRDVLRELDVRVVFGDYRGHFRNFLLEEEFIFTSTQGDRYLPYATEAEASHKIAAFRGDKALENFVRHTGGDMDKSEAGGMLVRHSFARSDVTLLELPASRWKRAVGTQGEDLLAVLTDRNIDTVYHHRSGRDEEETITIELTKPTDVSGLRITSRYGEGHCPAMKVLVRREGEKEWVKVCKTCDISGYYWSGPRFYYGGIHNRASRRFDAHNVVGVKLILRHYGHRDSCSISEVQLFGKDVPRTPELPSLEALIAVLKQRSVKHLYSDRWVAAVVAERMGELILTEREPHLFARRNPNAPNVVEVEPKTAFLVVKEEAPACREVFAERHVVPRETAIGPWILFDFGSAEWLAEYEDDLALYWAGYNLFLASEKRWAATMFDRATRLHEKDISDPSVIPMLEIAVESAPLATHVLETAQHIFEELGDLGRARELAARLQLRRPAIPAEIRFANGVEFVGFTVLSERVRPGGHLSLKYFWRCPAEVKNEELAVFVHFKDGGQRFQGDHVFLEGEPVAAQVYPELYVEERSVSVPADTKPGAYGIKMGLYERNTGHRIGATSDIPVHRNAVELPILVDIVAE